MKTLLVAVAILLFSVAGFADVNVRGYYRKDGTYVQPHKRSSPDNNPYNNYSTKGNVNPYTGEYGTVQPNPYRSPGVRSATFGGSQDKFGW